jgi:hypothetical protein
LTTYLVLITRGISTERFVEPEDSDSIHSV